MPREEPNSMTRDSDRRAYSKSVDIIDRIDGRSVVKSWVVIWAQVHTYEALKSHGEIMPLKKNS